MGFGLLRHHCNHWLAWNLQNLVCVPGASWLQYPIVRCKRNTASASLTFANASNREKHC